MSGQEFVHPPAMTLPGEPVKLLPPPPASRSAARHLRGANAGASSTEGTTFFEVPALVKAATTRQPERLGHRSRTGDNPAVGAAWLGSDLASRVMSPRKHPPEGAQNGTLTPAIGRTAAAHGAHTLDETSHDGEEQIQTQDPPNRPPHHVTSSLPRFHY
jgi:hypothetical protein